MRPLPNNNNNNNDDDDNNNSRKCRTGSIKVSSSSFSSATAALLATNQSALSGSTSVLASASTNATSATTSSASSSSSGGGNAKYLRFVRSKLSKTRLNSVLSLTSSTKESAVCAGVVNNTAADCIVQGEFGQEQAEAEVEVRGEWNRRGKEAEREKGDCAREISRHQLATSGFQAELVRTECQQHLVCSSSSREVEQLARRSQQLRLDTASAACDEQICAGHSPSATGAPSGGVEPGSSCLPLAPQAGKQQHQSSFKKSNFFQGFRYTLKGRRGSKQVQKQQQQQQQQQQFQAEQGQPTGPLQQSHSLTSISGSQQTGASRLGALGASKKLKHKLLLGSGAPSGASSQPSSDTPTPELDGPSGERPPCGSGDANCESETRQVFGRGKEKRCASVAISTSSFKAKFSASSSSSTSSATTTSTATFGPAKPGVQLGK